MSNKREQPSEADAAGGAEAREPWPHEDLLALAKVAAKEAGELALATRRAGDVRVAATKSSATDVVTDVDREVEQRIRSHILGERPRDGWLGEESGADDNADHHALRWVVDPIDGTVNYLYGLPGWAVSIAAEVAGQTQVAVVEVPTTGETFTAIRGKGSFLGGRRLAASRCSSLSQALVATGFSYQPDVRAVQGPLVGQLVSRVRDIRRFGAASVDLCAVAAGRVDAFFESGLNPWDLAAGALIAREAGAVVNANGEGDVVAAGPQLISSFTAELDSLR